VLEQGEGLEAPASEFKMRAGERVLIMDKRKVKTFRDKLLDRREGLVGQVQEAEKYSRERDSEATQDPADMAANAYTKELLVSMSANDRQLLALVDEALERIESGEYGDCVHCNEPVQEKRLEAVPWARHCLRCQDLQERGLLNPDDE
jgi:DnaK suppressor protein